MKTSIARLLIVFMLLLSSLAPFTQAHALQGQPLADILRQDGTLNLNKGFRGTLNLSDWRVSLDPQRGPILRSASATWQQMGNGTNGNVSAIAIDGNGNVIIGGSFTAICGNPACNSGNVTLRGLAVWNGTSWQGLGGYGMNGGIYAIALSGNNIYIGGMFDKICSNTTCTTGTNAKNIAYWNGSAWSGFGYGLDNFVFALAANGNTVYAGGNFNKICGNAACNSGNTTVSYIAKWDGVQWSSIGYGVNNAVYALLLNGSDLYAGGYFSHLCGNLACSFNGTSVNYIAKWSTSTSTWYSIGNGLNDDVRALALGANNSIYVGGFFTQSCGNQTCNSGNITVNRIAKWDGTSSWSALGNGVNSDVYALAVNGSNIYVAGNFSQTCGNVACNSGNAAANHIAAWNGSTWSMLANGVNYSSVALAANSTTLYAGGLFTLACGDAACSAGNTTANYVAKFSVPIKTILYSNAVQDGWILESSETSNQGGTAKSTSTNVYLGDDKGNRQRRTILSFTTSSLPDNAIITDVRLTLRNATIYGGGNPIADFQGIIADLKTGFFGTSALLEASDFQAVPSKVLGPFSPSLNINNGRYSINLTNGKNYINQLVTNNGLTQIRLRFKLDDNNDASDNYLALYSGEPLALYRPQLVITYYVP